MAVLRSNIDVAVGVKSSTRVRQDGSLIEDIYAFYAWTKTAEGWKMFAVSDVRVPV